MRPTPIAPRGGEKLKNAHTDKGKQFPRSTLPSKTLKRRRPRHSGFLEPGSVPRVHRVGPVHVPRLEVSLGVRKASLSNAVVLAHDQSVVERRQCCLVLLPPQMFGRLRTHGSAAGDQGHRPHFAADGVHPSSASLKYFFKKKKPATKQYTLHMQMRAKAYLGCFLFVFFLIKKNNNQDSKKQKLVYLAQLYSCEL